jgi:hypothetical protein
VILFEATILYWIMFFKLVLSNQISFFNIYAFFSPFNYWFSSWVCMCVLKSKHSWLIRPVIGASSETFTAMMRDCLGGVTYTEITSRHISKSTLSNFHPFGDLLSICHLLHTCTLKEDFHKWTFSFFLAT